jgi:hypothetical protein
MRSGSKISTASKPAAAAAAQSRFPNWSTATIAEHTPRSTMVKAMIPSR